MEKTHKILSLLFLLLIPSTAFASEWEWTAEPTPGSNNSIINEAGEAAEAYSNGTLSDAIILSEVMPNPEGTDNDNEWIEIYNTGNENVDLGNWQLDDEEEGSKPYTFPAGSVIEAQDFLVIYRAESSIALNNDADEVRLFDFEGTLQDNVEYSSAPEAQSYARINLEASGGSFLSWIIPTAQASPIESWREIPWEWTNEVTAGFTNPIYHFIEGEIQEVLPFQNKIRILQNGELIELSLETIELNEELKESLFQPGNSIAGYATQAVGNIFELKILESSNINGSIQAKDESTKSTNTIILILISGIGIYYLQRIRKKTKLA